MMKRLHCFRNRVLALLPLLLLCIGVGGCLERATSAQEQTVEEVRRALDLPQERPLNAAFLIVDGVYNTELVAPFDIFQHTVYHASPGIRTFTVSPDGETVVTAEGLRIVPDYSFENVPQVDLLIVPSAEHSRDTDLDNPELISWVRETGEQARFVLSLCWGAFVLAEAGLLEERSCTTFPSDYETFLERFPNHRLRVNASFVHDGKAITSQGGVRSFDAAMYLVDLLYGEDAARRIGGGLLIPWPPTDPSLFVTDPIYSVQKSVISEGAGESTQ